MTLRLLNSNDDLAAAGRTPAFYVKKVTAEEPYGCGEAEVKQALMEIDTLSGAVNLSKLFCLSSAMEPLLLLETSIATFLYYFNDYLVIMKVRNFALYALLQYLYLKNKAYEFFIMKTYLYNFDPI